MSNKANKDFVNTVCQLLEIGKAAKPVSVAGPVIQATVTH